jgi:uncharacterized protein (DUF302 family)
MMGSGRYATLCSAVLLVLAAGCVTTDPVSGREDVPDMHYIVESEKSFEQASSDPAAAVKNNGYGVLTVHDLGATLRKKDEVFKEECKIFECCNPRHAAEALSADMRMNMALPCRISVYTDGGKTKIGMIRPKQMLPGLSDDPALARIAEEVEAKTIRMIDEAK